MDAIGEMVKAAFDRWWGEQTRKGDPARNTRIVEQAFAAGFQAGGDAALRDAAERGAFRR